MISFSSFPMKMFAYEGVIFVPIAVPLICKKCSRTAKLSESNASDPTNKPPKKRLGELKCHLKKRGYNNASINHCFNKASGITQFWVFLYGCPVLTNDAG
jgi:hypothetical protein